MKPGGRASFYPVAQSIPQRITLADEIAGSDIVDFHAVDFRLCAGDTDADTRIHTAAKGLSRGVAELRRGNRDTITDFFGQQRLRAGENRWENG